jgi:TonB family protein
MRLYNKLVLIALCIAFLTSSSLGQEQQDQPDNKTRKMVTKIVPVYPGLAQRMSITGSVKIEGIIAPNGTVKSAEILGGHPVLAQAAIDAFRKSKWEPASHDTKEVVIFNFHP